MRDKLKYLVYCISTEIVETNAGEYKYPCYYPYWNSLATFHWEYSTLKTSVQGRYIVCSDNQHLESELQYLRKVFHTFNSYPHCFITKVVNEVNNDFNLTNYTTCTTHRITNNKNNNIRKLMMLLPYFGSFQEQSVKNSLQSFCYLTLMWVAGILHSLIVFPY